LSLTELTTEYNRLPHKPILQAVCLRLEDLADRLRDRRITIDVDECAQAWLAEEGYSDVYGARAVARFVRTKVSDPWLSLQLR
jgi:ATP-dependent Clp protease ATP-binding subunit ClpB